MCAVRFDRALAAGLLFLTGCSGISMDVPTPFLRLETPRAELKATTPDDARLWVREFEDHD